MSLIVSGLQDAKNRIDDAKNGNPPPSDGDSSPPLVMTGGEICSKSAVSLTQGVKILAHVLSIGDLTGMGAASKAMMENHPGEAMLAVPLALAMHVEPVKVGEFSISDWSGYPGGIPKPSGTFRLLEGAEYDGARAEANAANAAIRRTHPTVEGLEIHEIQPVKFNGDPVGQENKVGLVQEAHALFTSWWNSLQLTIEGK